MFGSNCFISVGLLQRDWSTMLVLLYTYLYFAVSPFLIYNQPKRVKFINCSQFLSHNFFGLDFHFYVIFLLIGTCQLDYNVQKKCSSTNFNSFSLTKSTTEYECELRYCDEVYLYMPNFLQD